MASLDNVSLFISYSRDTDSDIADSVHDILTSFGCTVCLDRKTFSSSPREEWTTARDEWMKNIEEIFLIVTMNIFHDVENFADKALRPQIQIEVDIAKELSKPVRAIILNRDAFQRLLGSDVLTNESDQATDLADEYSSGQLLGQDSKQKLWALSVPGLRMFVNKLNNETLEWANKNVPLSGPVLVPLDAIEEWDNVEQGSVEDSAGLYILTAPGGDGKTVVFSRRILENRGHAIRIPLSVLIKGEEALADFLGAPNQQQIDEHIFNWRSSWGLFPVFYVDALERTIGPVEDSLAITSLKRLIAVAPVFATARPEVWTSQLQWMMTPKRTIDITGAASKEFLINNSNLPKQTSRILTNALLIDHYIRNISEFPDLSRVTLGIFLQRDILGFNSTNRVSSSQHRIPSPIDIYEALAELQCQDHKYHIPHAKLRELLIKQRFDASTLQDAIDQCKHLVVDQSGNARLRHDLLDAANCAYHLEHREKSLLDWFDFDLSPTDLQIADSLIRFRADYLVLEPSELSKKYFYEIFDYLLRMFDVKKESNYRAWCATWILEGLVRSDINHIFVRTAIRTMRGIQIPSIVGNSITIEEFDYSSCTIDPPQRTRECVSSLTSVWRIFKQAEAPLSSEGIPALLDIVQQTKFRIRAIEALAKYGGDDVLQSLIRIGIEELGKVEGGDLTADPGILAPLVICLERYVSTNSEVRDVLNSICQSEKAGLRAIRLASTALHTGPTPVPVNDVELIEGFSPFALDRPGEPSDWLLVDEYASLVMSEVRRGRFIGDEVVSAMVRCLDHSHVAAASTVATALGDVGGFTAIHGLIYSIWDRPEDTPNYWRALRISLVGLSSQSGEWRKGIISCLHAIEPFVVELGDAGRSDVLRQIRDAVGDRLYSTTARGTPRRRRLGACIIANAVDVMDFGELRNDKYMPVDSMSLKIAQVPSAAEVGPPIEEKYRLAFEQQTKGAWNPCLVKTTWSLGRGFHLGLQKIQLKKRINMLLSSCLEPEKWTTLRPGIASVHVICILKDGSVLATKRPTSSKYSPGHWSLSVEEQIKTDDFECEGQNVAEAAAVRGIKEELGVLAKYCTYLCHSLLLEYESLNGCIAVAMHLDVNLDMILALRDRPELPSHAFEIEDITTIPLGLDHELSLVEPLHPTSQLRLEILREFYKNT